MKATLLTNRVATLEGKVKWLRLGSLLEELRLLLNGTLMTWMIGCVQCCHELLVKLEGVPFSGCLLRRVVECLRAATTDDLVLSHRAPDLG